MEDDIRNNPMYQIIRAEEKSEHTKTRALVALASAPAWGKLIGGLGFFGFVGYLWPF